MFKQTVVFDFDGVINSYESGWKGIDELPDPPVEGIREAIQEIRKFYRVVVVSTRTSQEEGYKAVKEWLDKYDIVVDDICDTKPPAVVYIDDRAITFNGKPETLLDQIKNFRTWQGK